MSDPQDTTDLSELTAVLKPIATSLATSVATAALMSGAAYVLKTLLTTNHEKSTLSGDTKYTPTEDEVALDKKKAPAKEPEGSLNTSSAAATEGELNASKTDATANGNQAKALEGKAKALETGAGATEIKTKAMQLN